MSEEITDSQWALIAPLLPVQRPLGRRRADDRQTLNGILWMLRTGARWQDLPQAYGSDTRCHRRLKEGQAPGGGEQPRRGKGTKLMVVTDGAGIPLGTLVASAQQAEVHLAKATLSRIRVPRDRGRARTRPRSLVADKGYDSEALRLELRGRGIHPCIPPAARSPPQARAEAQSG